MAKGDFFDALFGSSKILGRSFSFGIQEEGDTRGGSIGKLEDEDEIGPIVESVSTTFSVP